LRQQQRAARCATASAIDHTIYTPCVPILRRRCRSPQRARLDAAAGVVCGSPS
jgi:hypothetical protein